MLLFSTNIKFGTMRLYIVVAVYSSAHLVFSICPSEDYETIKEHILVRLEQ
jgi:transposase InsO family protein